MTEREARALREEQYERQVHLLGWMKMLLAIVAVTYVIALSVINVWTLIEVREQSTRNGLTLIRLQDCTTPGGHCYEQSQRQTGAAIGSINQFTLAAAWCARSLPTGSTEAQYRVCVTDRVTRSR